MRDIAYCITPRGITLVDYNKSLEYLNKKFQLGGLSKTHSLIETVKLFKIGPMKLIFPNNSVLVNSSGSPYTVSQEEAREEQEHWLISPGFYREVMEDFIRADKDA